MLLRRDKPTIAVSDIASPVDRKAAKFAVIACFTLALLVTFCFHTNAWCENGSLEANAVWKPADGPHVIDGDFVIPGGIILSIDPGTQVLFNNGASLVIEGGINALGRPDNPILFSSASENPSPGDWGNLRFVTVDTTLSYNDAGDYVKGSRLVHCIVEYGGQPYPGTPKEFQGGAIHCRKSSPYLCDLIIRYNLSSQGGGIYCHEFASPYVKNCLFEENEAAEAGGGLACFFYSNAVVVNNIFQANKAGEHGGGIYFSFSSPQIIGNIIENNFAGVHGGGLYCSNTVTQATSRVRNNVLLSNRAEHQANSIYLTAKIETIFQENCFIAGEGYDVYINALEEDLDLRGNYFGPPSKSDLESRIFDSYDDPSQQVAICDPVLESPPAELPNAPRDITFFDIFGDDAFSLDWPHPLCEGAPIYLEAHAQDNNPYHADWIPVRLRSSVSNPKGITALAWETGPSTGIFRIKGKVGSATIPRDKQIKGRLGETLFFSVEGVEGFEISRPVDAHKSYILSIQLPEETDTMHVVNHMPKVAWVHKDILGYEQQKYQIQLSAGVPFAAPPYWDSAELIGSKSQAVLRGVTLEDDATYGLRLRIFCGSKWSDWAELTMRMNSTPTLPQPIFPGYGVILANIRPQIILRASTDAERDEISYELQLCHDPEFKGVLAIEKEAQVRGSRVRWAPPTDLADDAEYYWRAQAYDAYEPGEWTETGQFWVNLIEEPPLPFGLLDPEVGVEVYPLQPVFSWEETSDPDPLSSVKYRLSYSRNPDFTPATTLKLETENTFIKALRPLYNKFTYYWKVEAIDNTGRITVSDQIGNFYVNTTPTVPVLSGPLAGEELHPEDTISWNPSSDPNPDDLITYYLQIGRENFATALIEDPTTDTGVILEEIEQFSLLTDNVEYIFRVRAEDNHGITSDWSVEAGSFFFNKVNDPPGPVTMPITPDNITVTSSSPVISWGPADDVDHSDPAEKLSYLIQFDQDGDFIDGVRQVQVMAGVTSVTVSNLTDNQPWFYRIHARDDDGAISEWSETVQILVNTVEDKPNTPELLTPEIGAEFLSTTPVELTWTTSSDPDFGAEICYEVSWWLEDDSGDRSTYKVENGTTYTLEGLAGDRNYTWQVVAVDNTGLQASSDTGNFQVVVPNHPPQEFNLLYPENGQTELPLRFEFTWETAVDNDPDDEVRYKLYLARDEYFTQDAATFTGIIPTSLTLVEPLDEGATYYWKVMVQDRKGLQTWGSSSNHKPFQFTIEMPSGELQQIEEGQ